MWKHIKRSPNFFMDFFVEQRIPEIYAKILFWNETLYTRANSGSQHQKSQDQKAYSVSLIPEYLDLEVLNSKTHSLKTKPQTNLGYAIKLTKEFEIESYLKKQLKSNFRNVKKRQSRLETSYEIDYRFFYGAISEENYLYLMQCLYEMLVRRFDQRQDINEKLKEWKGLLTTTRDKICKKNASLFVIYDHEVPIDISLNYHVKSITFGAISSYDIDYSKFGLGAIEKIKIMEWCLENGYRLLDFGYGDLEYKRIWSNYIYKFNYQVIFNRNSVLSQISARLELVKLQLKEFLKSKKIDVLYKKIRQKLSLRKGGSVNKAKIIDYQKVVLSDSRAFTALESVDYELENILPLKSAVNDFIYATREKKSSVRMLRIKNEQNAFLIKGEKEVQKIIFKD